MPARPKLMKYRRLLAAIVEAERRAARLTYIELGKRLGLNSGQHAYQLCKGIKPIQFYHLDKIAKSLNLDHDHLMLIWAATRLLDEQVPESKIAFLVPGGTAVTGGSAGISLPPDRPRDGNDRDAGLRGDQQSPDAPAPPKRFDFALFLRLIQHAATLFPETEGNGKAAFSRLAWTIGKLLTGVVLGWQQLNGLVHAAQLLIMLYPGKFFRCSPGQFQTVSV